MGAATRKSATMDFIGEMIELAAGRGVSLVFPTGVDGVVTVVGAGADVVAIALAAENALYDISPAEASAIAGASLSTVPAELAAVKISVPFAD